MSGRPPQHSLREQMQTALRARHYSERTERAYVQWVMRFLEFHGTHDPVALGDEEINSFVTSLAVKGGVSASTQTQALSAVLFLYRYVLGVEVGQLEGL
ncbi:MAG: site-specific integrase, partial [Coriobacteriia bacterium]